MKALIALSLALLATGCIPGPTSGHDDDPVEPTEPAAIPSCRDLPDRTLIEVMEVEPPPGSPSYERHFAAELWPNGEIVTEATAWAAMDPRTMTWLRPGVARVHVISSRGIPFEVAFCHVSAQYAMDPR